MIDEFVDWQKFDRDAIEIYNFQCENNLQNVDICDVLGCNQLEHCQKIDDAFEIILQTFKSATQDYRHKKVIKFVPVPGWNEHCKDLHEKARQAFVAWVYVRESRAPTPGIWLCRWLTGGMAEWSTCGEIVYVELCGWLIGFL